MKISVIRGKKCSTTLHRDTIQELKWQNNGPKTKELLSLLDQTIELLDRYEEAHWSRRLGKAKKRIENRDFSGLTYLLNAYGGMGSLNDLGIHPLNGHKIDDDEVTAVNNKLDKLRGRMFEVADQIRREVLKG